MLQTPTKFVAALGLLGALGQAGCGEGEPASVGTSADPVPSASSPEPSPAPAAPPPTVAPLPSDEVELPPTAEAKLMDAEPDTEAEAEAEPDTEPADSLAAILPTGPEPGSAEADAELLALLDESTVTAEEFEAAFRQPGGVAVDGDALVFGHPTRATPIVDITQVSGTGSVAVREIAEADPRLEVCQAMALSMNPASGGSLTLRVIYSASGAVDSVSVDGEGIGSSLTDCLVSVAEGWTSPGAKGELQLTLSVSSKE